jgi:uncharacterized protein (DUF433 family)
MTLVSATEQNILRLGAYTLPQASRLSRVHLRTVSYWFDMDSEHGPAIQRFMPENDLGLISFVDLVQLLAVHTIRHKRLVSLQKIRQAVKQAEDAHISYPFCRNNARVYLWGNTVVIKTEDGDMFEATGKTRGHYLMEPVVLPYLKDLTFQEDGMPNEYRPLDNILLTPKRNWGAPIVESCNYTVETLVNAVQSEGSIDLAADMCGVTVDEVRSALKYEDHLAGIAA